jgi:hypothetical protein
MISLLSEMPPDVLAFTASGQVTGEDYEKVLVPAIDKKLAEHDKLRILYHIGPEFKKFTTTALWDDAKIGLHHLTDFERIALVTDVNWLRTTVTVIGRTMPGRIRAFTNGEFDQAKDWISERP